MLILQKIRFKNFFSYGNYFTEIELDNYKTNVISSFNGSGKSSAILDTITFVLYGKSFRKINKSAIINSINKKDCIVEIYFLVDNKSYKIIRGIKPNLFEIYEDNKLIPCPPSINDYQNYLEKNILKINYKTFINVIILGSAKYSSFMDLSLPDRRDLIEELLDIKIFSVINNVTKEKLKLLKEDISNINHSIDINKEKIKYINKLIESQKKVSNDIIQKRNDEIENYKNQNEELELNKLQILKNVDELLNLIINKKDIEEKYYKAIKYKSKLDNNIEIINKDNIFYENNFSCPTCKQDLNKEFKLNILNENKEKLNLLSENYNKIEETLLKINNRINKIENINNRIISLKQKVTNIDSDIKNNNKNIEKNYKEIYENSIDNDIEKYYNDKQEINNELVKNLEEEKKITNLKKNYEFILGLLKEDGIKKLIIKQYIPFLNKRINYFLNEMNFFVSFSFDETFEETIKSRFKDEFKFNSFSEGEKLRMNLAILFAFRDIAKMKNSINCNLLVMDEIFDSSVDSDGVEDIFRLISSFSEQNIFVISHKNEMLEEKFERKIIINKIKNFSRLETII